MCWRGMKHQANINNLRAAVTTAFEKFVEACAAERSLDLATEAPLGTAEATRQHRSRLHRTL